MLAFNIAGLGKIEIEYIVLDYNGTLAKDGVPIAGVSNLLKELSKDVKIFVLTADTFGNVSKYVKELYAEVSILSKTPISEAKNEFVNKLGKDKIIAIGNGRNDALMLKSATIGIGLMQKEGISKETLLNADVIFYDINDALNAILHPKRLIASLRL